MTAGLRWTRLFFTGSPTFVSFAKLWVLMVGVRLKSS